MTGSAAVIRGPKFSPSWSEGRAARAGSPGESEERGVVGRRRTVRAAEPSRFQPRVPRLRGARVSVSVPLGGEWGGPPVR